MRLDCRINREVGWFRVWHVTQCRQLMRVVWVDDESAQYGEAPTPTVPIIEIRQARRIEIYPSSRVILIDPIENSAIDQTLLAENTA